MIENETVNNILSDQKRRDVLKKGVALTGAAMLPSIFAGKAFAAGKPKEVVLVYWTVDGDESVVKRVFAEYQIDHGIRPRWERTPNIEEYMQKVLYKNALLVGDSLDCIGVPTLRNIKE